MEGSTLDGAGLEHRLEKQRAFVYNLVVHKSRIRLASHNLVTYTELRN
jgi:hypothetical protein